MTPTLPVTTERELQRWIIDQARSLGWGVALSARKAMLAEAAAYRVVPPPLDGLVFHPQYSLGSEPGWPDLTLIRRRDRRLIFAELKAEKGVVSARQAEVLELLRSLADAETWGMLRGEPHQFGARIEVYVWRPSDVDAIVEVLR